MTDTKPDSQILDSLDWTPGCDVEGCENTAELVGFTHCGKTVLACAAHVDEERQFAMAHVCVKCKFCHERASNYADLIEWRSL